MWRNEQQSAFEEAKRHLCSPSVLAHYDPEKPLILSADASPYGIGAVLSHQIDGEEKPIDYQIQFKLGKDIAHADMLSRLPLSTAHNAGRHTEESTRMSGLSNSSEVTT